jgi:hypothetical protein
MAPLVCFAHLGARLSYFSPILVFSPYAPRGTVLACQWSRVGPKLLCILRIAACQTVASTVLNRPSLTPPWLRLTPAGSSESTTCRRIGMDFLMHQLAVLIHLPRAARAPARLEPFRPLARAGPQPGRLDPSRSTPETN